MSKIITAIALISIASGIFLLIPWSEFFNYFGSLDLEGILIRYLSK